MEESENNTITPYLRAEKTALRLIARAEQCTNGLSRKLERRGHDPAAICEVISNLCEKNLLDDNRYARLWLQSRIRLTRTPRRLLSSLCARGIDRNDAEAALKTVLSEEGAETALIERFARKYARKIDKNKDNARSLKFLLKSEGFSITVIRQFLGEE